uniref:(northern house mosquito) hypothetical protein n=1 Tax=Culex pipiens TaxID=7175 RepID=A0A8D8J450_CULPI
MDKDTSRIFTTNKMLEEVRLLNARNDKLLKDFGIDLNNLSDAACESLTDYAKIKQLTGLTELEPSFVDDYCYQEQSKALEARLQTITLKAQLKRLRAELKAEETDLAKLEHFVTETQAQLISSDEMEKLRVTREKWIEMLRSKQKTLMEKADVLNLDDLIAKVNAVEAEENA